MSRIVLYVEGGGIVSAPKSDLPQGTLDMLVLRMLSHEPLHGYAIAQRLRQISREVVKVPQGTLYPALHRLENRKLLAAEWKTSETGRKAKYYRLTAQGRKQLQIESESWERLTEAVKAILRGAQGEPG
jgi:transcriptional regulator